MLVGRGPEIKLLLQRLEEAREGHGQVILVGGEAGIGKTYLVEALARHLAENGAPCLMCWCSPRYSGTPLAPFVDLVRRLAGDGAHGPGSPSLAHLEALVARAALPAAEVVPLLVDLLELSPDGPDRQPSPAPGARRRLTLEALRDLLLGLAEERGPLALVTEDLHWADPSTLELLDLLVARGRDAPLLTLLTFRPEFEPPWEWRSGMTLLPVGRLGPDEAVELIEAVAGDAAVPPAVRREIAHRAGGVPLFVVELTRATLVEASDSQGGAEGAARPQDIPATLEQSLTSRFDRLEGARAVAQRASVFHGSFSLELLARISHRGEAALVSVLDELVAAGVLERSGLGSRTRYQFRHVLLQEVAYRSLPEGERRRLHETVLQALDERFPEVSLREPELAAHHATEAGLAPRAIDLWQRAGWRAFERSASAEAVAHFRRALELAQTLPSADERERSELTALTGLGPALIAAKGYTSSEVEATYRRAGELCQRVPDAAQQERVVVGVLAYKYSRAQYRDVVSLLDSLDRSGASGEVRLIGQHIRQGTVWVLGDCAASDELFERVEALSRGLKYHHHALGHDVRAGILSVASVNTWHLGYPERALGQFREAMAWAGQLGHPLSELFALHMGLWMLQLRGEPETVVAEAKVLRERAVELELPYFEAEGELQLAWAATSGGPGAAGRGSAGEEAALERLRRAVARHEELGMLFGRTYRLTLLADACLRHGRLDEVAEALAEARAFAERTGEVFRLADIHRLSGELLLARGGPDAGEQAEAAFRRALETARRQGSKSLELRAAVGLGGHWRRLDRAAEARELVSSVYDWFTEGHEVPDLVAARGFLGGLS